MAWKCEKCGGPMGRAGMCCNTPGPDHAAELERRAVSVTGDPEIRMAAQEREYAEIYDGVPHPADDEAWLAAHPGAADEGTEKPRTIADIDAEFWDSREGLKVIREMAHARIVSPWALLAEVLARCVTLVSPKVQLPPLVGGPASLNLFFGVVGASGGGKGGSSNACEHLVNFGEFQHAEEIRSGRNIGSGEGIPKLFVDPQVNGDVDRVAYAALVSVAEIDSLTAQIQRNGAVSTLAGQIRQAWNGEALGFHYANKDKRTYVARHDYRLCMVVGIQEKRAGALMGEADGGTPQRFIFLPARDAQMPAEPPAEPGTLSWSPYLAELPNGLHIPSSSHTDMNDPASETVILDVCEQATTVIRQEAIKRHREPSEALDGHMLLCREKVAAALALFDRYAGIRDEDWRLAGLVMEVSAIVRGSILSELSAEMKAQNEAAGYAEASRASIVKTSAERDSLRKCAERITKVLGNDGGWMPRGKVRSAAGRKYWDDLDETLEMLAETGRVRARPTRSGHGEASTEYALPTVE